MVDPLLIEMADPLKSESKYERLRKIGIGSYGVVFKCANRVTGQMVAIKRYSEDDSDPVIRKIAMREVKMLRQLRHPNLINLIEVFRRKRRLHLVFDYCELTVLDVIERYGDSCPSNLIKKIVWQIVNGISYCHDSNCIHRDIKPENILINQWGVVKVCDFGFARNINPKLRGPVSKDLNLSYSTRYKPENLSSELTSHSAKENLASSPDETDSKDRSRQAFTEYVATRWYRAPELLIGEIYYGTKIDIWAIGCVTAELIRGEPLFPGKTDLDQLLMIRSSLGGLTAGQVNTLLTQALYEPTKMDELIRDSDPVPSQSLRQKLPTKHGHEAIDFVAATLEMDPNNRPTSAELLQHSYIYSPRMIQFLKEATGFDGPAQPATRPTTNLVDRTNKDTKRRASDSKPAAATDLKRYQHISAAGASLKQTNDGGVPRAAPNPRSRLPVASVRREERHHSRDAVGGRSSGVRFVTGSYETYDKKAKSSKTYPITAKAGGSPNWAVGQQYPVKDIETSRDVYTSSSLSNSSNMSFLPRLMPLNESTAHHHHQQQQQQQRQVVGKTTTSMKKTRAATSTALDDDHLPRTNGV